MMIRVSVDQGIVPRSVSFHPWSSDCSKGIDLLRTIRKGLAFAKVFDDVHNFACWDKKRSLVFKLCLR